MDCVYLIKSNMALKIVDCCDMQPSDFSHKNVELYLNTSQKLACFSVWALPVLEGTQILNSCL